MLVLAPSPPLSKVAPSQTRAAHRMEKESVLFVVEIRRISTPRIHLALHFPAMAEHRLA
jgi:hypothetical protein